MTLIRFTIFAWGLSSCIRSMVIINIIIIVVVVVFGVAGNIMVFFEGFFEG